MTGLSSRLTRAPLRRVRWPFVHGRWRLGCCLLRLPSLLPDGKRTCGSGMEAQYLEVQTFTGELFISILHTIDAGC